MCSLFRKKPLLDPAVQQQVVNCIRIAESGTTGEIRVFLESHCAYMDAMDRAKELFLELGMDKTERRNAVLLYLAIRDHQFAIIGDKEIYEQAGGPVFWAEAARHMQQYLAAGRLGEGICVCITELGNALAAHFPYDPSAPRNELPDEIVFGK